MEPITILQAIVRLLVAAGVGMLLGLERERLEKAAGFRTLALVSSGSATLVIAAAMSVPAEAVRMAAGVATGIGFLGAGVILQQRGQVTGITTAASVWVAAALGICAGLGSLLLALFAAGLTLFILIVLGMVDIRPLRRDGRTYEITYQDASPWDEHNAREPMVSAGLAVSLLSVAVNQDGSVAEWHAVGRRDEHERAIERLLATEAVQSFKVRL